MSAVQILALEGDADDRARTLVGPVRPALPGADVQVVSRDRFVAKPHLNLTFHNCEVLDYLDRDDADFEKAVEPVLGPHEPFLPSFDHSTIRPLPRGYPVTWSIPGEDAEVVLTPESFRPNVLWMSDQDDYVIIAKDPMPVRWRSRGNLPRTATTR